MKKIIILIFFSISIFASDYTQMKKSFDNGNTDRAISYTRYHAMNGNINAMYDLGLLYYAKGSLNKAKRWFESSVENGGQGELAIALILFSQSSTKSEYRNILDILSKTEQTKISSALSDILNDFIENKNDASAQSYLSIAKLFSEDKVVKANNNLAFFLLQKAANKEDVKALEMIGDAYNTMQQSPITAPRKENTLINSINYYQKAYKLGNYDAMAKLGRLYLIGPRHVRRITKGRKLIETSAMHGSKIGKKILKDGYSQSPVQKAKNSKKSYHLLFKEF